MEPQETTGSQPWSQQLIGKMISKFVKTSSVSNDNVQLDRGEGVCATQEDQQCGWHTGMCRGGGVQAGVVSMGR